MYKNLKKRQIKSIAQSVHRKVFNNFTYITDIKQYGVLEKWVMPDEVYNGSQKITGDCDDFALACRKLMREAGVKTRLVYCLDETGEGHLVLEASGYILDNRQTKLMTNKSLMKKGYQFLAISGYESGDKWFKLA
tara:strand:- start:4595 stop:4999 length:405 start_codon:yes stop_codon:yes gene_type:complete